MSQVTLKGVPVTLGGSFIKPGNILMNFRLVNQSLEGVTLEQYKGKPKLIITVPSLDTPVCSKETIDINRLAVKYPELVILVVSRDLPFAAQRFCKNEKVSNITTLSDMYWDSTFAQDYGVKIKSGPLTGLHARAVFVADAHDKVIYSELVHEITNPPNFDELEAAVKKL